MTFKIGDRVEIIRCAPCFSYLLGHICTVTDMYNTFRTKNGRMLRFSAMFYRVDIPHTPNSGDGSCFRRIEDEETASWEKINAVTAWRPLPLDV